MAATTSPSLLLRIRNPEDEDAWQEFHAIYSSVVHAYCFQRQLQPPDADDITQEVMATVATRIRNFEYDPGKGRFRGWLGTITMNRIRDWWEKKNRRSNMVVSEIPEAMAGGDSDWVAVFSEQIFRIACERIRSQFNSQTWQSFEDAWVRNLPPQEIAQQLGIALHTVYVNKSRVLKRLEEEVRLLAEDIAIPNGNLKG